MTATEIVLERGEGTRSVLTVWSAAEASAPVVLVVPAMGMPSSYYHRFGEALAAAGVHCSLMELRGHEASGGRLPGRDYDFGYVDMVDDVADAVAATRAVLPGAPVVLLGHSMGGQVGFMYAALHPGELAGIVLMASSTPHWRTWAPWILPLSLGFVGASKVLGHFPGQRVKFAGRESRGVIRDWAHLARTGRFVAGEEGLSGVDLPVLAVSVEGDWLGPRAAVDALVAKLPVATVDREHVDAEGIDHFKWARRPEVVVPRIVAWAASSVRAAASDASR
ncbi:alpha/beta fold hydrolase [Nocardioides sp. CER19]|uniref:alpha/beta fold hydrolase n=1 Tax=Nocardioides sp. CER19 TaxID=3038538 RepID=UPI00244D39E8|nr:alpha/beta fold hydrolase [Nocardioides sp. CER19]MDH2412576.1 alpha/beta fold hydrolase [Nocardioides sp. CER19]